MSGRQVLFEHILAPKDESRRICERQVRAREHRASNAAERIERRLAVAGVRIEIHPHRIVKNPESRSNAGPP